MKKVLFWILSLTWGLPYSFIGLVVALFMLITGHKPHHIGPEIYFECSENFPGGCNLGPVFLVWKSAGKSTKLHECGHSIQNIIWGPLQLIVVAIPSLVRATYRTIYQNYIYYKKKEPLPPYDSIWFEGQATRFGYKYFEQFYKE